MAIQIIYDKEGNIIGKKEVHGLLNPNRESKVKDFFCAVKDMWNDPPFWLFDFRNCFWDE